MSAAQAILRFEQNAYFYEPGILVWPGLIMVAAGLVLWLAGLRMSRVCAMLLAGLSGAIIGYSIAEAARVSGAFLGAAVCSLAALAMERFVIILLGSMIVGFLILALVLGQYSGQVSWNLPGEAQNEAMSQSQTLADLGRMFEYCWAGFNKLYAAANKIVLVGPALVTVVLWGLGLTLSRFIAALSCSSVGSALIFAGMVSLHKAC